jgi:predicted Zn finger-like uncharacterized protein
MFTVCPKCALTLVVTAQDLRVAQGYVRCGRCSNVFNAIVGLTDDRGALAANNAGGQGTGPGTASTSIIRKAPSINDDEPHDPLSETGETEAVYAEPDADEVKFQEVFSDPPAPSAQQPRPFAFIAPPPGPPVNAPPFDSEKRYSDTEGIETYPEHELEFNPERTDVTKVFVEAAPVTFRTNAETGRFEKIVLQPDGSLPPQPTKPASAREAAPTQPKSPAPRTSTPQTASPTATSTQSAPAPAANGTNAPGATASSGARAANGRTQPVQPLPTQERPTQQAAPPQAPPRQLPTQGATQAPTQERAAQQPAPQQQPVKAAPPAPSPPRPPPPPPDAEDLDEEEDFQLDNDLRELAQRVDVTASRPAQDFDSAANDESVAERTENEARFAAIAKQLDERDDRDDGGFDEDRSLGDIYAKATPRPPPPPRNDSRAGASPRGRALTDSADSFDGQIEADLGAATLASEPAPRSRFMLWVGAAAVLSLALVAQAIHNNRNELATNAVLNRPLTRFYKAIGVTLVPSWDLTAYDVRQLGASTNEGGPGTLTVRASVKNNAGQPLPLPLLRITMQDRYGNRIATRDVDPKSYVPGAVPRDANLGIGQRIDAEMTFKDPGQDAVGFEIDACLLNAAGRIACANDAALAAR